MILSRRTHAQYSDIVCPNGLQVCFIYSDSANKAALSLSIQTGNFSDPDGCLGLAHLFEHMMFASSENHAKGNDLHELLTKNRGYVNAWTSAEHTNFHFDCASSVFLEGLDRLVDILLKPMYSELGVEREISAIDAEFKMRLNDDVRRLYDVHRATANPEHPFSRFSVGNADEFSKHSSAQLVDLLTRYHQQHLFGQNIKVAIVLPTPKSARKQSALQNKIIQTLSLFPKTPAINDENLLSKAKKWPLYRPEDLNQLISVVPQKETINAIATFVTPAIKPLEQYKPLLVLSHIFEDSSDGSLKHYLKRKNWCTDISANGGLSGENYQEFSINFKLTQEGEKHLSSLLSVLMLFIEQCKGGLIESWQIIEKAEQLSLQGNYNEAPPPIDEAVSIASRLHTEGLGDVLENDLLLKATGHHESIALNAVLEVLKYFKQSQLRVFYISKHAQTRKTTKFYEVAYDTKEIELSPLHEQVIFNLAKPNEFMPSFSSNKAQTHAKLPLSQLLTSTSSLWVAYEPEFDTTKSDVYLSIEHHAMGGCAQALCIKKLWLAMVNEYIESHFGHAEYAGLYFKLYGHQAGLTLHLSGFSEKQNLLANSILSAIEGFTPQQDALDKAKSKMKTSLSNALLNKPINRLFFELNCYFQKNTFSHSEALAALPHIDLDVLCATTGKYWQNPFVEQLFVDSMTKDEAINAHKAILSQFKIRPPCIRKHKDARLLSSTQTTFEINSKDKEHACICYFQAPDNSTQQTVLTIMLEKLLSALLFDGLRNKRKLGYMVGCGFMPINGHPGLSIYVQSTHVNAHQLKHEIVDELNEIIEHTNLSERRVNDLIKTLQDQFTFTNMTQSQFAQKQWLNLDSEDPKNEDTRISEGLAKLNLASVNQALDDLKTLNGYKVLNLMTKQETQNNH